MAGQRRLLDELILRLSRQFLTPAGAWSHGATSTATAVAQPLHTSAATVVSAVAFDPRARWAHELVVSLAAKFAARVRDTRNPKPSNLNPTP